MRGVFTAAWFMGVMGVGAVAGIELAHYRQSQMIKQAKADSLASEAGNALVGAQLPIKETAPPPVPRKSRQRTKVVGSVPSASPVVQPSPLISTGTLPSTATADMSAAPDAAVVPTPAEAPNSGVRVVISLPDQRAYVFKDGKLWDSTRVSTGRKGRRTPVGTYTILEKAVWHRSNKYSNAPMPYMQRITWGGVALHAGYVPGYPASHGCIRMPRAFAKRLYRITNFSSTVVVTDRAIESSKKARRISYAASNPEDTSKPKIAPKPEEPNAVASTAEPSKAEPPRAEPPRAEPPVAGPPVANPNPGNATAPTPAIRVQR